MSPQVYQFRDAAARHRYSLQYTVPWQSGKRVVLPLNNIGYLSELQVLFQLTVTVGTIGTVTDAIQAKTNYLPFLGLRSPQGAQVWTTNSRDVDAFNYRLFRGMNPTSDTNNTTWAPGTSGAQNVTYRLRIPVSANDGANFDMGMLMRQISNNQFFVDLQMANPSDLVGGGTCVITSITGTITVEEVYYDAVIEGSNVVPPNFQQFLRLRSLQSSALLNGQNDVRYDTGPVICDAHFLLVNNGAADGSAANLSQIQVLANKGNQLDLRTGLRLAYDGKMHLGQAPPPGWYFEDFFDDLEAVNETRGRDLINSALAAQLDFMVQYAGTPSGTSYIEQFYREVVTLGA